MQKLLYITDQDEYVDHSFIAPLFEVYLRQYLAVDIVYFTDFKSDFSRKDNKHFVVPSRYKNVLTAELKRNNVALEHYDYIMVRNNIGIMKQILKYRKKYQYKALFRFSFPKRSVHIHCETAKRKNQFVNKVLHYFKTKSEIKIINKCDAFLPTSKRMHKTFRPGVSIPSIICSPAIDPQALHPQQAHTDEKIRFIYVGTLDIARNFNTVLDAFSKLENKQWKLYISTRDVEFAHRLLENYPHIKEHIEVYNPKTKNALLTLIAKVDIGIALLPDLPVYNTSTPVKIFDYYASGTPCLMTLSDHISSIFTDSNDAWFSDFDVQSIQKKLQYLLSLRKEELAVTGYKGQQRLLDVRNYENIAEDIAKQLQAL